jgi:hypothetical protein
MGQNWRSNKNSCRREAGSGSELEKPVEHGVESERCAEDGVGGMKNR